MTRIGILGGSFDPVHFGHLHAANWALRTFDLSEVRLIPAKQSPFKGPSVASDQDRRQMLALAAADNPAFVVEDCELNRPAPSYTIDTLRELGARTKDGRFVLILGSDAADGFNGWKEAGEIRKLAEVRVLARRGHASEGDQMFPGLDISSSEIRNTVRAGGSVRYLVPEPVRLYIEEKGLYQ